MIFFINREKDTKTKLRRNSLKLSNAIFWIMHSGLLVGYFSYISLAVYKVNKGHNQGLDGFSEKRNWTKLIKRRSIKVRSALIFIYLLLLLWMLLWIWTSHFYSWWRFSQNLKCLHYLHSEKSYYSFDVIYNDEALCCFLNEI